MSNCTSDYIRNPISVLENWLFYTLFECNKVDALILETTVGSDRSAGRAVFDHAGRMDIRMDIYEC